MTVSEREAQILETLERHLAGVLKALRDLRACRSRLLLRELRFTGVLSAVRGIRVFCQKERAR